MTNDTALGGPPAATPAAGIGQAFEWLRDGYHLLRVSPRLWFGMTLIYFLIAAALRLIPFMGGLVLILISPWLLAGALVTARDSSATTVVGGAKGWINSLISTPVRRFTLPVRDEHRMAALAIACVLVFGFALLIRIVEELVLKGGSMATGLAATGLAPPMGPGFAIAVVMVGIAYVTLLMAVYYLVPLVAFRGRAPIEALLESFQTCLRHAGAWFLLIGIFFIPYAAIVFAYAWIPWTGVVLTLTLGFVLLPLFVSTSYASFEALFPDTEPSSH
jgi:hypothetical protein